MVLDVYRGGQYMNIKNDNRSDISAIENYYVDFFNVVVAIVKQTNTSHIVWVGEHPICSILYQLLIDLGIDSFCVVDNDLFKQGNIIVPFVYNYSRDDSRNISVVAFNDVVAYEDTVCLMANTHFDELKKQAIEHGICEKNIYSLYELTLGYSDSKKKQIEYCSDKKLLSLKEIQNVEMDILRAFRDYCDENSLRYTLAAGTLLGAVRHEGFIPWDDDIDVYMPLEDYLRLMEKQPTIGRYKLINWKNTDNYFQPYARLVDTSTIMYEYFFDIGNARTHACIDIFPLVGFPEDVDKRNLRWDELYIKKMRWFFYYIMRDVDNFQQTDVRDEIEKSMFRDTFAESKFVGMICPVSLKPWIF